jgi:hypothetical protein
MIVDVTQQPELKQKLLGGQLNLAVCPHCGAGTMLGTQLVYHDAAKQLCLVYIPQELNLSAEQQEQIIGESTGILMQNLPPDVSRAHLLTPRRFMSLASLVDAILEADGIPREVLEQQRRRADLISQLAMALQDENQFAQLVEQNRADLTPDFFAALDAFLQASVREQRDDSAQVLSILREKLAAMTGYTGDGQQQAGESDDNLEMLLDSLAAVSDEELEALVVEARPSIDYGFFQAWTGRIEALQQEGKTEEAERLTSRRARILEIIERMDKDAQAMFEASANVLRAVLHADDPRAALQEQGEQVNEAFLMVLSANIESAQRAGQSELAARMEEIAQLAFDVIQERLPADERLINLMMMAETPQESTSLLRANASQVTPEFVKKLNELADEHEQKGVKPHAEKLRRLAREAGAMLF